MSGLIPANPVVGNKGIVLKIAIGVAAAVEYDGHAKNVRLTSSDKDESDLSFKEAAEGATKDYALAHQWVYNRKPNKMANNGLKYQRIDAGLREQLRQKWNRPVLWPIGVGLLVVGLSLLPAVRVYRRREGAGALVQEQGVA